MASSRSLHTVHLAAFGAGNVVGLGVMSMAGIGVGITGTGLWLAALVGGLGGAFALVPQLLASSSGDYPGGQYQQVGTLLPPVFGGIVAYILCFLVFDISAYALSAAQLLGLPMLPTRLTAALVVALFLGVHMLGSRIAAIAQLVMAVLLASALGTYVAVTMPHVRLANLAHYTFLGSPLAFLFACVYMTFMMNGVAGVANYAAVADRPRVTVPRAMRVSLLLVVVTYALICVADAGALPIAQVANRDLAVSLSAFVPAPVTVAFVVGGSAFALLTTLNAAVGCVAYPVASACADGWLPRELGEGARPEGGAGDARPRHEAEQPEAIGPGPGEAVLGLAGHPDDEALHGQHHRATVAARADDRHTVRPEHDGQHSRDHRRHGRERERRCHRHSDLEGRGLPEEQR